MRVLEAAAKKLRIIVLIASCALLGSTQQGCRLDISSSRPCIEGGESCVDDFRCMRAAAPHHFLRLIRSC